MHFWAVAMLLGSLLLGCGREPAAQGPSYLSAPRPGNPSHLHLAIHPLHNPAKLDEAYRPLIELLNRNLTGVQFDLEASRDYPSFEAKVRQRTPEFILPNPWQTLMAMQHGYAVIATAGASEDFKGLILARRDSGLRTPTDLKGKNVSYPAHTALAACIMPQFFLHSHGLDIRKDITNLYVGSQESSIMNAYLGLSSAAATWPPPWRAFQEDHPKEAAELLVLWETPSLINNSVMVREDIPQATREAVVRTLIGLVDSPEGLRILARMHTARFTRATNADYEKVRTYVARFEKQVRRVEEP